MLMSKELERMKKSKNRKDIIIPSLYQFEDLYNYSRVVSNIFLNKISWNFHSLIRLLSVQGLIRGIPFLKKVNSLIKLKSLRSISSKIEVSQVKMDTPVGITTTIKLIKNDQRIFTFPLKNRCRCL